MSTAWHGLTFGEALRQPWVVSAALTLLLAWAVIDVVAGKAPSLQWRLTIGVCVAYGGASLVFGRWLRTA